MSMNEVYRQGQYVPVPVPAGTPAGTALRVGVLNLVTVSERATDEHTPYGHAGEASGDLGAAWILPVTISGGPLKWGQAVYITADGKLVTAATTASVSNTLFGAALEYNVPNGTDTPVAVKILN